MCVCDGTASSVSLKGTGLERVSGEWDRHAGDITLCEPDDNLRWKEGRKREGGGREGGREGGRKEREREGGREGGRREGGREEGEREGGREGGKCALATIHVHVHVDYTCIFMYRICRNISRSFSTKL